MLYAQVNNKEYKFSFSHFNDESLGRGTRCKASCDDTEVAHGISLCSPKDNFDRNTGRKLALARALKELELSKEERLSVWMLYFKARNGKV